MITFHHNKAYYIRQLRSYICCLQLVDDYFPPQQGLLHSYEKFSIFSLHRSRWLLSTTTRLTTSTILFLAGIFFSCRWLLSTTTRLTTWSCNWSALTPVVDDYFPPQQGLLHYSHFPHLGEFFKCRWLLSTTTRLTTLLFLRDSLCRSLCRWLLSTTTRLTTFNAITSISSDSTLSM